MLNKQINIELQDTQWQFEYVDNGKQLVDGDWYEYSRFCNRFIKKIL